MLGVDIFWVKDGIIVEHRDVVQTKVTDTISITPLWTLAED